MSIGVRSLKTCISHRFDGYLCNQYVSFFYFSFIGFSDAPTPLGVHFSRPSSVESLRGFTIGNPLGCRGSVCVEVMTTLHGSASPLRRRTEGCVPSEGMAASVSDLLKSTLILLESP